MSAAEPKHTAQRETATLQNDARKLLCGLGSGAIISGLFNPWDRALYLSVTHRRRFLDGENWRSPYQGFKHSIFIRMIGSGLYFPLEDIFMRPAREHAPERPRLAHFLAGVAAGSVNAAVMNPGQAAKYALWGSPPGTRYRHVVAHMWREGGAAPFIRGVTATVTRDAVFGGTFALLRYGLPGVMGYRMEQQGGPQNRFWSDLVAAAAATALSSPFNYVRNIKYGSPAATPIASDAATLRNLLREAAAARRHGSALDALSLLQQRLRLGWGTLRTGVGMAAGAKAYTWLQGLLEARFAAVDAGGGGGGAARQHAVAVVAPAKQQQRRASAAAAAGPS